MQVEQKIISIYSVLGAAVGLTSNFFTHQITPYPNLLLALAFPAIVYIVSTALLLKTVRQKKVKWLVYNSLVTYILIWLVVWILLYNL